LFFEYQTIGELAGFFAAAHPARVVELTAQTPGGEPPPTVAAEADAPGALDVHEARIEAAGTGRRPVDQDVAVIGMAGRFPMAANPDELWENLVAGRDCIVEVPLERWDHRIYASDDGDSPGTTYARWGGFIDDVDRFDARFFGISPKDAEGMDPQQRLFLETAWAALEDGGYTAERARGTARRRGTRDVGVFAGVTYGEYQLLVGVPIAGYWAVANRVSYHLGLNGPSMAVDTACSSSLTAIHLACESLRRGECGYAVAGGVNVTIHPGKFLLLGMGHWASTDGRCRTFGAGGDGYVPGEGVATVVLKPLSDALEDGDRIYGVIRASGVNQDGRTNGFTVPNPEAQADLVLRTLHEAGLDGRSLSYVEAHGTGTALGDPIEVNALTTAFRRFTSDQGYCRIGSAKSSIGHLEAAAGVVGLIKTLLQLDRETIAPTLHADPPNPNIDFAASPFTVARQSVRWPRPTDGVPRTAAVSSFGAGGSNAHIIVQDAMPEPTPAAAEGAPQLLVLSARRPDRLKAQARNLARFLRSARGEATPLAGVAWTLAVGREPFEHRLALVAATPVIAALSLERWLDGHGGATVMAGVVPRYEVSGGESADDQQVLTDRWTAGDLHAVGGLWVQGWAVEWESLYGPGRGRVVRLPTYPFARDRYWIVPEEYNRAVVDPPAAPAGVPGHGARDDHSAPGATPGSEPAAQPVSSGGDDLRTELERQVQEIFVELTKTPIEELHLDDDFLDFGFDSVVNVRMLNRLMALYDVEIPGTVIEEYTTIRSLADHVIRSGYLSGTNGHRQEESYEPVLRAPAREPAVLERDEPLPVTSVLLTGVTGVLGGKLVYDLLANTSAQVHCLVRGDDVSRAKERVRHFLDVYDVERRLAGEFDRRVEAVLGDVGRPGLGIEAARADRLAEEVDLTVHAAARTTLITFYDALAPVNVAGTRHAIDFALRTRHRYLAYVSSFSALGDWLIHDNPPFRETDIELGQGYADLPYHKTKYHAEKLVRAATDEGLVWNIFRPGNIMGDSRNGRYPFSEVTVKGVFYDIFKTVAETGISMLTPNHWDVTPVDFVSAGLLHLSLRRPRYRETYHLTNPDIRSLFEVFALIGEFGYPVRPVSIDEFHRLAVERLFRARGSEAVYESQTIEMVKYGIETWGRQHYEMSSYADSSHTCSILSEAGIVCPPVPELVDTYLRHCVEVGYLEPPPAGSQGPSANGSLAVAGDGSESGR
jgi:thioester reductase-like protein